MNTHTQIWALVRALAAQLNPSRVTFLHPLTVTWGKITQYKIRQVISGSSAAINDIPTAIAYPYFWGACAICNITGSLFQLQIQDGGRQTGNTYISA